MNILARMYSPLEAVKKLAVCTMLVFVCVNVQAQSKDFKKLSKIDGVEHIHINKFLLKLAAMNEGNIDLGNSVTLGDNSGDILRKIDAIDIYASEKMDAVEKMGKKVRDILKDGWEPLIDVKEQDGEKVKIYQLKKGKQCTFVIFAEEEKEASLVIIKGETDIAKLLEQQMAEGEGISTDQD